MQPEIVFLASLSELAEPFIAEWLGTGFTLDAFEVPFSAEISALTSGDWLTRLSEAFHGGGSFPIQDETAHEASRLLLMAGITIVIGVAGEAFFKRTGIPDVIFLLTLGIIVGPILGIIDYGVVLSVIPYFAALALIVIMFDGGMSLDLKRITSVGHYSIILAVAGFIISVAIVATIAHYGIGWDWPDGILLGSIVGGSSSAIVFGLVRNIKITDGASNLLAFESAITDILATIVAFILFGAILAGFFDPASMAEGIMGSLGVGLFLGAVVGIPWMIIIAWIKKTQHAYMLTLGVLFVLYYLATHIGESGALTALVFGLLIGNRKYITRIFRIPMPEMESSDAFHSQLVFLVRVFFFVFIGLLASFGSIEIMIFGIVCALAIYGGRIPLVRMVLRNRFPEKDRKVTNVMIPRGLAAAVLATLPITFGLPNAELYPQAAFFIILATIVITSAGLATQRTSGQQRDDKPDDPRRGRALRFRDAVTRIRQESGRYRSRTGNGDGGRVTGGSMKRWIKERYDGARHG